MKNKKELFIKKLKDGRIVEFRDGSLGIYLRGTIIKCDGGLDVKSFSNDLSYWRDGLDLDDYIPKRVFTLRKDDEYLADILFWLCSEREFLNRIKKVVWENK